MSLVDEYRRDVERIQESVEKRYPYREALDLKIFLDNILPFILVLITFILLFEFFLPVNAVVEKWVGWANWTVIAYFSLRLLAEFRLSSSNRSFLQNHWFDVLLVVPLFSMLREVKLVQAMNELRFLPATEEAEEGLVSTAAIRNTGVAARLTRITRKVKRSV